STYYIPIDQNRPKEFQPIQIRYFGQCEESQDQPHKIIKVAHAVTQLESDDGCLLSNTDQFTQTAHDWHSNQRLTTAGTDKEVESSLDDQHKYRGDCRRHTLQQIFQSKDNGIRNHSLF